MKNSFNFAGCQFASFTYTNSYGEVSTQTVLLGATYENAKLKDIATLEGASFPEQNLDVARLTLLTALLKNMNDKTRSNQSKGQIDAYTNLYKGIGIHNETGKVSILAKFIKKTVSAEQKAQTEFNKASGEFKVRKVVNSRQTTLDKKEVTKTLDLEQAKIRRFNLSADSMESARVNGDYLVFA
jgi:uncharacterized protein YjbI with pentapeptide repeats